MRQADLGHDHAARRRPVLPPRYRTVIRPPSSSTSKACRSKSIADRQWPRIARWQGAPHPGCAGRPRFTPGPSAAARWLPHHAGGSDDARERAGRRAGADALADPAVHHQADSSWSAPSPIRPPSPSRTSACSPRSRKRATSSRSPASTSRSSSPHEPRAAHGRSTPSSATPR